VSIVCMVDCYARYLYGLRPRQGDSIMVSLRSFGNNINHTSSYTAHRSTVTEYHAKLFDRQNCALVMYEHNDGHDPV
jgi:hypothetical protein